MGLTGGRGALAAALGALVVCLAYTGLRLLGVGDGLDVAPYFTRCVLAAGMGVAAAVASMAVEPEGWLPRVPLMVAGVLPLLVLASVVWP